MEISVRQMSMKPKYIGHLLSNGIVLVSHLSTFDKIRLAQKIKLTQDECEEILTTIKPKRPHYVTQLSELILKPFEKISTLINELDSILGGGIKCGQITEISGEAGAGKSNLCASIGTLVMLPKCQNGLDGEVLFIHTEGEGKMKLAIKRFRSLAASVENEEIINSKLSVINCSNEFEIVELVNRLPEIIEQKQNVKLIIIDSITCAFIQTDEKLDQMFYHNRSLRLTKIVKILTRLAWDKRLAVLATNHVSYDSKCGLNKPALGRIWSHMCQTKIYLERNDLFKQIVRFAHVSKGASSTPSSVRFRITNELFDMSF